MSNKELDKYYENIIENLTDDDIEELYEYEEVNENAQFAAWETDEMMLDYDNVDKAYEVGFDLFSHSPERFLTKEILDLFTSSR